MNYLLSSVCFSLQWLPLRKAATISSPLSIALVFTHCNDKCQVGGDIEPYLCALWSTSLSVSQSSASFSGLSSR